MSERGPLMSDWKTATVDIIDGANQYTTFREPRVGIRVGL